MGLWEGKAIFEKLLLETIWYGILKYMDDMELVICSANHFISVQGLKKRESLL